MPGCLLLPFLTELFGRESTPTAGRGWGEGSTRLSAPGKDAPLATPGHLLTANPPFPGSLGSPGERLGVKNPSAKQETRVRSLSQEGPLEEEMATHSSVLSWEIPRTEEPGWPQSLELQRVVHD